MTRFIFLAVFGCAALVAAVPRQTDAATITSLFQGGANSASDEDRDYLIDRNFNGIAQGLPGSNAGSIDVGDSLRFLFNINTVNSVGANAGGTTPNNEWTGLGQIIVLTKSATVGGVTSYTFGVDPAFSGVFGTGAIIVMFEDVAHNFAADFDDSSAGALALLPDDGTPHLAPHGIAGPPHTPPSSADVSVGPYATEEAFIATAIDGTRFWTLGFTGPGVNAFGGTAAGPGEGWNVTSLLGFDNILAAFVGTTGTSGLIVNAGLNRLVNGIPETGDAILLGKVPTPFGAPGANFAATGTGRGVADLDTPFEASSDLTVAFNVIVPEPSSFAIFGGLGLLVAAWRRRR